MPISTKDNATAHDVVNAARAAFEDASSRGFPANNRCVLWDAWNAAAKAGVRGEKGGVESAPPSTEPGPQPTTDTPPTELMPGVEVAVYPDGTQATGVAPLPEQSPAQQDEDPLKPVSPSARLPDL